MVALPLFKIGSLFLKHVSKYGANRIKHQAHEHPSFRKLAARYGQSIHQLQMRLSVALLRNVEAEQRAKEKAEAPTVKTKEQVEKEAIIRAKYGSTSQELRKKREIPFLSVWTRKFRPLPEAKAVDLFADVIGDTFILGVAVALLLYEWYKATQKPDANLERIKELNERFDELEKREKDLEESEKQYRSRVLYIEEALRNFKDPKTKQPLLPPTEDSKVPTTSPPA